jgi:DNA-binding HxlR family transcriptional regulator
MRKPVSSDEPGCGLEVALAVMGGKWKPLILYHLRSGPKRFGDLKRLVAGISEKVLIQQLRELAAAGVLVRRDYREVPPKVDYAMTPFGMTLAEALRPLCEWGTEHRARVGGLPNAHRRRAAEGSGSGRYQPAAAT